MMNKAVQEMDVLHSTTKALNEARITVVEFLDTIEVEQKLSIREATKTLQKALRMYERAVRILGAAGVSSILGIYYSRTTTSAQLEKELVSKMFKAVLKQDISAFNDYYQTYVKSLL